MLANINIQKHSGNQMSKTSILMLPNTQGQVNFVGAPIRADGWYGFTDGLHTIAIYIVSFTGRVVIEASLADQPTDDDWFPVQFNNNDYMQFPRNPLYPTGERGSGDSATIGLNFTGNYTWLRASVDRSYFDYVPTEQQDIFALGYVDHILLNN
jgi:hypothetical protein